MVKAVAFHAFGLENLQTETREPENLGPDQVRVKVHAVSLNYRDYMMARGWYNPRLPMPLIPLSDGAGEVIDVGADVTDLKVGDRVCSTMIPDWEDGRPGPNILDTTLGGPRNGMFAQQRVLPQQALLKLPEGIGFAEAACLPVAGLTAWSAMVEEAGIGAGSKVLLLGTGGVSIMGLTIAKKLGAEVVITSSSDKKLARAKALGADHLINYRENPRWDKAVREIYPDGVDVVLEVGGDGTFDQSVKAVASGGHVALIGVLAHADKAVNLTALLMRRIRVQGILVGSRAQFGRYLDFVASQHPEIIIDRTFEGMASAREAFEYMASGGHFGKIVVTLDH